MTGILPELVPLKCGGRFDKCPAAARSTLFRQTSDFIDILKWQPQWLVVRTLWRINVVERIHDRRSTVLLLVYLRHLPSFEPRHLRTSVQHVVPVPARYRHKRNSVGVVADLLDVSRHFLLDLVVSRLQKKPTALANILANSLMGSFFANIVNIKLDVLSKSVCI